MKATQFLGPTIALAGVAAAFGAALFADPHIGAWVLAGVLVLCALLRVVVPEPREWGLAVRSIPVDVGILLVGAVVLVFLAQTAPDLY